MRIPANIDRSGFHKGEYVGYACSKVWKIRKCSRGWRATIRESVDGIPSSCESPTLAEISEKLYQYHEAWENVLSGRMNSGCSQNPRLTTLFALSGRENKP